MQAALIDFELESATQNVQGFYSGYASTWQYFTREAVCSALTYSESIWQDKKQEYAELAFPFESTPASPLSVKTMEVVYKAGDAVNEGLLRFGKQELLLPGSQFRCAVWGDLPALERGQIFLIGKKRAPARIIHLFFEDVEPNYEVQGPTLPVQLSPRHVMAYGAFAPLVGTYRYFIVKLPLHQKLKRFAINDVIVPIPEL